MKLTEDIEISGLGLYLKTEKTLVIADLHLGIESSLQKQGYLVPIHQFDEIKEKLNKIFKKTKKFKKIIINGDFKHEFGKIQRQEWNEGLQMLDLLKEHCDELILTKGNHDPILGPIARKRDVRFEETGLSLNSFYITHGHKIPETKEFKKAKTIIIGNEHPALGVSDGVTTELYKCFLKGLWKNKTLIVQPSFCQITIGTDILKEEIRSPFLEQELGKFEVFVVADKVRYFGKIKNLLERKSLLEA